MKFKKTMLSLATLGAVAAPIASVVACGNRNGGLTAMGWALKLSPSADVWMVADGGKVSDKSFNEPALAGVAEYGFKTDTTYNLVQPEGEGEISKGYNTATQNGAKVIVGAGFNHGVPAQKYFLGANKPMFIGIDNDFVGGWGTTVPEADRNNLASIIFPTEQAGYLAGVYAVEYIATHKSEFSPEKVNGKDVYKAATFGGGQFGAVTSWMDGFVEGIKDGSLALDASQNMAVEMVYAQGGAASVKDFTTDSFTPDSTQVGPLVKSYLSSGADVIFPVAGPQIKKTIEEIKLEGAKAKVIGVDGDQRAALGSAYRDMIIGSAVKSIQEETKTALQMFYNKKADFINEYIKKAHSGKIGFAPMGADTYVNADFGKFFPNSAGVFSASASLKNYTSVKLDSSNTFFGSVK